MENAITILPMAERPDILVQVRLPKHLADAAKIRAAQMGLPLAHWVRRLLQQEIETQTLEAWSIDPNDKPEHTKNFIAEADAGNTRPPYLLAIKSFDGHRLTAQVYGTLSGNLPHVGPLRMDGLQQYGTFRDEAWKQRLLYTKPATFWRIDSILQFKDAPALLGLVRTDAPAT